MLAAPLFNRSYDQETCSCSHKETHAQMPVIMQDMPLWQPAFRPHPATNIGQPSGENELSHRILMQLSEQYFAVRAFRTYPGPKCFQRIVAE